MLFSIQMFIAAAILILIIWWTNEKPKKTAEKVKCIPDLRKDLVIDDHGVLSSIKSIEALVSEWNAIEGNRSKKAEGIEGLTKLAGTLKERRDAREKRKDTLDDLNVKLTSQFECMSGWLKTRIEEIQSDPAQILPTHNSSEKVH